MYELNIDDIVKVKLTSHGIEELKRQYDSLPKCHPELAKFKPPEVDEEGFSEFRLDDLMSYLGRMLTLDDPHPFENTIRVEPKCR